LICREFKLDSQDAYAAELVHSNLYLAQFPSVLEPTYVVTCWRKDTRFHKEVIEYSTAYGDIFRSPHMDIEPITDHVLFRWHKHQLPPDLTIKEPTILTVRVMLDAHAVFESYVLIEKMG
jgi:hypothetical protein